MKKTCKIVMYHYVRPIKNSSNSEIKGLELEGFKRQINFFKKKFNIISIQEFFDSLLQKKDVKENSLLLTFDDGLKDHFLHVYPILKKNNIQGSFFVPSKPIYENIILDVHKIHLILSKIYPKNIINIIQKYLKNNKNISFEECYSRLAKPNEFDSAEIIFIKRMLQKELPFELRHKIIEVLFEKYCKNNHEIRWDEFYLSTEDMSEMSEGGMYFGAHGHSHEWCSKLTDKILKSEIEKSYKFCSQINQEEKRMIFCYPYGDFDKRTISYLRSLNFDAALTTKVGDAQLNKKNAFILKRYDTNHFPQ